MMLYFYFAANADNYTFALSPAAVNKAIGMANSTYRDQFKNLENKGYLVRVSGNQYVFYEKPHKEEKPTDVNISQKSTDAVNETLDVVKIVYPGNIEINNKSINNLINKGEFSTSNQVKESVNPFNF